MSDKLTLRQGIDLINDEIASQFNLPTSEDIEAAFAECDAMFEESAQMCCAGPIEDCAPEFLYSEDYFRVQDCYSKASDDEIMPGLIKYIATSSLVDTYFKDVESLDDDRPVLTANSVKAAKQHAVDVAEMIFTGGISYSELYETAAFGVLLKTLLKEPDSDVPYLAFLKIVDDAERALKEKKTIEEIKRLSGAKSLNLDIDGNGTVEIVEALTVALSDFEFERYLPVLDKYGIKHPLDTRNYPPEVKQRIYEIADKVESEIGIKYYEDGFCEAFIPAFIEAGEASFADGGLCLGYTEKRTLSVRREPELTSKEAFAVCMDPKHTYGSCSEMTYKIMGAIRVAGVTCHMSSFDTENHVFPSYLGVSLDPTHLGEIGWSRGVNPASIYHFNVAATGSEDPLHGLIASLIDPHAYYDVSAVGKHIDALVSAHDESGEIPKDALALLEMISGEGAQSGIFEGLLHEFDPVIAANPKTISIFNYLSRIVSTMPNGTGEDLGFAIIKRWPDNPHALRPLTSAIFGHPDYQKSKLGDRDAARRFGDKLDSVVSRLEKELPSSGFAETVMASFIMFDGRYDESQNLLAKALEHNPDNAIALSLLANAAAASGRYDEAAEFISRAMEIAPNLEGNHSNLAIMAQLRGDMKLAATEAKKEATVYYDNVNSTLLAAGLALTRMKPIEALEILDMFPSEGIWESTLAPTRAQAHLLLGDFKKAKGIISEGMRREPDNTNFRQMAAFAHLYEFELEAAQKEVDKVDISPMKAIMETHIALYAGDLESAEKQLEAVKSIPGMDKIFTETLEASLIEQRGDLSEAREIYSGLLEERSYDVTLKVQILAIDLLLGKTDSARKLFGEIRDESPELFLTKTIEPLLLLGEGKYKKAISTANEVLKSSPTNVAALSAKGLALVELGRPKAALKIGDSHIRILPKSVTGYLIKARAYLAMGRISKAEDLLEKVREVEYYDSKEWPLMSSSALAKDIEEAKANRK